MDYTEYARNFFCKDIFATQAAGIYIEEAAKGYAKCSMEIKPHHMNAGGSVMGGAIFTLADFAFAIAANCGFGATVTLMSSITFHSPVKGKKVFAKTECIKNGRTSCSYLVRITDDAGVSVATVSAVGHRTPDRTIG